MTDPTDTPARPARPAGPTVPAPRWRPRTATTAATLFERVRRSSLKRTIAETLAETLAPLVRDQLLPAAGGATRTLLVHAVFTAEFVRAHMCLAFHETLRATATADVERLLADALRAADARGNGERGCEAGAALVIAVVRRLPGSLEIPDALWRAFEAQLAAECEDATRAFLRDLPGAVRTLLGPVQRAARWARGDSAGADGFADAAAPRIGWPARRDGGP